MYVICTEILSEIRTELREWAVWQARAGCYSQVALSSNDSNTLYMVPYRRRYDEKRGDLEKSQAGVDLDELRETIARKKEETKRLRAQEDRLREEKAVLDEHQEWIQHSSLC